jgi:hypothetical protein
VTDDEIEICRREKLAERSTIDKDVGQKLSLEMRYGPETFGCHEALHVTHLLYDLIETQLLSHGAILQNADWFKHVYKAQAELGELYQSIGAAHFAEAVNATEGLASLISECTASRSVGRA